MRIIAFAPLALCGAVLHAQDYSWPRQIPVGGGAVGTIVLYQPQAETLAGFQVKTDAVHGFHCAARRVIVHAQIVHLQNDGAAVVCASRIHTVLLSLGFEISSSPVEARKSPRKMMMIMMTGATHHHQYPCKTAE